MNAVNRSETKNADHALADKIAWALDDSIPVPGTDIRVGADGLLGLIPGIGDAIGAVLSTWIVLIAARLGAPTSVLLNMGLNTLIDSTVGAIPVLGDLFDLAFKSNRRNLDLLESHLRSPEAAQSRSRWRVAGIIGGLIAALALAGFLVVWAISGIIGALT